MPLNPDSTNNSSSPPAFSVAFVNYYFPLTKDTMAEAVGEAVLTAVLQTLFGSLASKDVLDFIRSCNMEKEVEKLKETMSDVESFLEDAENQQYENKRVRKWLDELRDAAYDAEDVIDDVAMEALRKKLKVESQSSSNQLPLSFLSSKFKKVKKTRKIKKIIQKFDELVQRSSNLGLKKLLARSSRSNLFRETSSLVDEIHVVYGREDDKKKILDRLLKEDSSNCSNKFSVIPIVGMGGLGKTTLAQIVSNDDQVKDHIKAWVCVSDENEFDVKRLTRAILTSVTSRDDQPNDLNSLHHKLKDALTRKKFLIVLDDVWKMSHNDWELLCRPFGFGAAGSAIIMTTRNREISSNMGTVDNYDLNILSDDDCWSVFYQHAFGGIRTDEENPDLVGIGKKIVKKCKGLPLAAKSLGGLLRRSKEESEWENVLNNKLWDLQEGKDDILPILKLSYYHLPSHLKRCFAYLSIIPKDYEFKEEMVVLLWMAEGFLHKEGIELEDFGRRCFGELLSRSFFQPSSSKKGWFVMHDLMSDLAQWIAGETCFMLEDSLDERKISDKARHSYYLRHYYYDRSSSDKFEVFNRVFYLRTFISRGWCLNIVTFDWLSKLKFLRVLSLRGYKITELPSWIGKLKHLRYLDLSQTNIESLPDSICTLYNLQTLILRYCGCLKKLPEDVKNLINLRHLDISYVNLIDGMPLGVGRLTSLRKLSNFVVGKDSGSGLGELMKLMHLQGTLRISKLENVIDAQQTREVVLSDKKGLNVLDMEWRDEFDDQRNEMVEKEVLDMLHPHKKLKELTISYYGGVSFPTWVGDSSFSNMVLLELEGCKRCTALPPYLGKLPLLKDLRIRKMNGVHSVGAEFYGEGRSNHFPLLETLIFEDMQEWTVWLHVDQQNDSFARLRELSIEKCPKLLKSLPDHLPSLDKLAISGCKRLTVNIPSCQRLHNLKIIKCQEVVQGNTDDLSSTGVEHLEIDGRRLVIKKCPQLLSLVAKEEEEEQQPKLEYLEIEECENLENLKGLHNLTSLRYLTIRGCPRLVSLLKSGLPAMLRELQIWNCTALTSITGFEYLQDEEDSNNCHRRSLLEVLSIFNCPSLTPLSSSRGWELPTTLKTLTIKDCPKLESLDRFRIFNIKNFKTLHNLRFLLIRDCKRIVSFPEEGFPTNIRELHIRRLKIRQPLSEWGLHRLTSLEQLCIEDVCPNLVSFPADEGIKNVLPSSIIYLNIEDFPNLKSLSSDGFQNLSSLQKLTIHNCPKLQSFPKKGLFPSLLVLNFYECPLLTPRCERDRGHEWPKISHVPAIYHPLSSDFWWDQWRRIEKRTLPSVQAI